ncbi:uncharacterized protein LOC131168926 [Hevea brasiliensis]|uniref:uncharacterized protein LOC131168926 n=1 Tax=Hevea brasiliensis TaxID=3981 RepID=UPI0025F75EED|nr:uncharacterized protein LOC131168926 [Hevea brasiliensis]
MDSPGIVLVVGATGGFGKSVVDILKKKGQQVRVLACALAEKFICRKEKSLLTFSSSYFCFISKISQVRNEEKARMMLGSDIDLIVEDITKEDTLVPEYFKGVRKVINAASVIVGPKEGDTPERAKYSQGIKFFEPENFSTPEDLSAYDGLELRLKGDDCWYKLIVRTSRDWDAVGYTASFDTVE